MYRTDDQTSLGGGSVILLYRLDTDGHAILQKTGTAAATGIADVALDLGYIKSTNVAFQENGGLTVTMPHLSNSQKWVDFRETACPVGSGSTTEVVLEDGQKLSPTGGTAKPEYLAVIYPSSLTDDGQECIVFPCTVTNTSGSFTTSPTDLKELSFELVAIPAKADITVLKAMHVSELTNLTTVAQLVIAEKSYYKQSFIEQPA
jgi:hypothetical protein